MSALQEMGKFLPYAITKRINKTPVEARGGGGDGIYKRRNRRDYRVLMQYNTWVRLKTSDDAEIRLDDYEEGYVVLISPAEYFGENYPDKNPELQPDFVLGETGIVYYTQASELADFPPLDDWFDVVELKTEKGHNGEKTWVGDVCFDVKNANPQRISYICRTGTQDRVRRNEIINELRVKYQIYIEDNELPDQRGLGNYDYDYANKQMIENVKLQMLYLILTCEDENGINFARYIKEHYSEIKNTRKDTQSFTRNVQSENYYDLFQVFFAELKDECNSKGLINLNRLAEKNVLRSEDNKLICPLCCKQINCSDFFTVIEQDEGRQVLDNTQREIVLMHISALRPCTFHHKIYNLGWGHNYCNMVQGSADIDVTVERLREIIDEYIQHVQKVSKK